MEKAIIWKTLIGGEAPNTPLTIQSCTVQSNITMAQNISLIRLLKQLYFFSFLPTQN